MVALSREGTKSIGVLFVDDHEIFHECMATLLDLQENMRVVGTASNGRSAVKLARELRPEVVVMDISMPALNGIDATRKILEDNPQAKVIALSMHADREIVLQALEAGAKGYIPKAGAFKELVLAIQAVSQQQIYLSPRITGLFLDDVLRLQKGGTATVQSLSAREREVLQLLAEGQSTRKIAEELHLSVKTIETHRGQIMKKLNLTSLADLVKYAVREGLTPLS